LGLDNTFAVHSGIDPRRDLRGKLRIVRTTVDTLSGLAARAAAFAARAASATHSTRQQRAAQRCGGVLHGDARKRVEAQQQLVSGRPLR
jgi:hypothetical protein